MYPNLKLYLWKSGIRQNRLAQMLSVDETMLSRVVNGFREPSTELRMRIASVLQCEASWLFEKSETINPGAPHSASTTGRGDAEQH